MIWDSGNSGRCAQQGIKKDQPPARALRVQMNRSCLHGADDGNRTRTVSLGS